MAIASIILWALAIVAFVGTFWPVDFTKDAIGAWLIVAAIVFAVCGMVTGALAFINS